MKAFFILNSLSAEEKAFLRTKQISGERTPDEWLDFFKKLRDFDADGDSTRKLGFRLGWGGLIAAFFSLLLLDFLIGLVLMPVAILVALTGWIIYFYIKRYDIAGENLTRRVIPILMILREEMRPDDKLKMQFDLRGFSLPEKMTSEGQPYQRGVYFRIVERIYRDRWLNGQATLADGTRLIWSIDDLAKRTTKEKRKQSGKLKLKTKYKDRHRTLISMQIGMHKKRYLLPEKIKQKGEEGTIRTRDSGNYSWMEIRKIVKHPAGKSFHPGDFVNVVASAYVRAIPAQGGKK